jgi:6-phosphogluconolactonase
MSPTRLPLLLLLMLCLPLWGCGSHISTGNTTRTAILYGAPNTAFLNTFVTAAINPDTGGFSSVSISTPPILNSGGIAAFGTQFLYVSEPLGSQIYGFSINSASGALTALAGSPFKLPSGRIPEALAATPNNMFLYAADAAGGVDAFQVNATTGALSPLSGSPFGSGDSSSVAVDPSGQFLYASDYSNGQILAFTIGSAGTLTPIPGSPFALPGQGSSTPLGILDTGSFVYAALYSLNEIAGFSINAQTGALTPVPGSPFSSGEEPATFAQSGSFLYAIDDQNGSVSGYNIDASNGSLTAIPGSPFFQDIGTAVADPQGKYLYLGSSVGILGTNIDPSTGALTPGTASLSNDGTLWMTVVLLPAPAA